MDLMQKDGSWQDSNRKPCDSKTTILPLSHSTAIILRVRIVLLVSILILHFVWNKLDSEIKNWRFIISMFKETVLGFLYTIDSLLSFSDARCCAIIANETYNTAVN